MVYARAATEHELYEPHSGVTHAAKKHFRLTEEIIQDSQQIIIILTNKPGKPALALLTHAFYLNVIAIIMIIY